MMKERTEQWYAMRVTYGREMKVQAALDAKFKDDPTFRTYVPKCYKTVVRFGKRSYELASQVPNLIFIYSTQQVIQELKTSDPTAQCLRFMKDRGGHYLVVPTKQMDDFMRVGQLEEDKRIPLTINNPSLLTGQKVRIIEGELAGVEGRVVRLHGNKKVVVHIEDLVAVAISFIPSAWVTKIDETEQA